MTKTETESHPIPVVHHTVFTIDVPEEKYPRGTVLKIHDALKEIGVLEITKIDGYSKEETK